MTWNVHVAPGNGSLAISPHRLMGPRPGPVPPRPPVTDSTSLNITRNTRAELTYMYLLKYCSEVQLLKIEVLIVNFT